MCITNQCVDSKTKGTLGALMRFGAEWTELVYISGPQKAFETNIPGLMAAAPTRRPDLPWSGTIRLSSFCTHTQTHTQKLTQHRVDLARR